MNMDERILRGDYRGKNNFFLREKFEDDVRPIVDFFHHDDEFDTTGMNRVAIFKTALSVAKKRGSYTPTKSVRKKKGQVV